MPEEVKVITEEDVKFAIRKFRQELLEELKEDFKKSFLSTVKFYKEREVAQNLFYNSIQYVTEEIARLKSSIKKIKDFDYTNAPLDFTEEEKGVIEKWEYIVKDVEELSNATQATISILWKERETTDGELERIADSLPLDTKEF